MEKDQTVQDLAHELYSYLASRFPVCCASDEFVFFPQTVKDYLDWSRWDDLSPGSVEEAVDHLNRFQGRLSAVSDPENEAETPLVSLLAWVVGNLEEQFTLVKSHAAQPTFPLTVATVGLIQALQSGVEGAWDKRLQTLPTFLSGALDSLSRMSELYRDLGVEMAREIIRWLPVPGRSARTHLAQRALESFVEHLTRAPVVKEFRLAPELLERIVRLHTGSGLALKEALQELEDEACSTRQLLTEEARTLGFGSDWESAYSCIAGDTVPEGGKQELLKTEIHRLREHCNGLGLMKTLPRDKDRITIEPLPRSLTTIRAADSYNALPGHPFQGGVFYIFGGGSLGSSASSIHPVYRMTAAHETYPGHHLLDLARWSNHEAVLRPLEYPLFYEGWACYGEDLMESTLAFDRPSDRLILLRRRFRHAVRGKVDLMLHSGRLDLNGAALELAKAGFLRSRALETARKYALRPAYQMCYTIGRRRFQRLHESHGKGDIPGFVNTVLSSGELLFEDLERALKGSGGGERESGGGGERPVSA